MVRNICDGGSYGARELMVGSGGDCIQWGTYMVGGVHDGQLSTVGSVHGRSVHNEKHYSGEWLMRFCGKNLKNNLLNLLKFKNMSFDPLYPFLVIISKNK